jgi:hypothetical protein
MKSAGEATVEPSTMEATAMKATSSKAAAVEAAASKATTVTTTAAVTTAATTASAASKCRRRLNQADSRQCEQSHHPIAYHACLHDLKSPTNHETLSRQEYSATKKTDGKLTVRAMLPPAEQIFLYEYLFSEERWSSAGQDKPVEFSPRKLRIRDIYIQTSISISFI